MSNQIDQFYVIPDGLGKYGLSYLSLSALFSIHSSAASAVSPAERGKIAVMSGLLLLPRLKGARDHVV